MVEFQTSEEIAAELRALNERSNKIMGHLAGRLTLASPPEDDVLLNAQLNAMANYASMLKQRMALAEGSP